jgi:hypothetical protein
MRRQFIAVVGGVMALLILALFIEAPSIAAGALLHPRRLSIYAAKPAACIDREFAGAGVVLRGWYCPAGRPRRGSVVYLHGIADNRSSSVGVIDRMTRHGFDVVAYDSRGHGQSGGDACTYGFYEKEDVGRIVNALDAGPVVLIGSSLGGAVALQAAAGLTRVTAVVAAESFSDLRTIAIERAPRYLPSWIIDRAFRVAEAQGRFTVASVSPADAAASLRIPVLLVHGARDRDTSPDHSRRILSALVGTKKLILVPDAAHNGSMSGVDLWNEIDRWLDDVVPPRP